MHALRNEVLPPSGVEFATCLNLTPASRSSAQAGPSRLGTFSNIVVARSNFLRIFEVRHEPAPVSVKPEDVTQVRRGTEAVEGEVAMDEDGEGFVNVGTLKSSGAQHTVTRVHFIREHHLHGIVTGIETIQTLASSEDKLDRILISFKDAKIALLEWSATIHDLVTVSIHTYERAPQLMSLDASLFRSQLRVDSLSRCAALSLPKDSFAILPFYQKQSELETDQGEQMQKDVPYSPSFILDLTNDVDSNIRNVMDFVFLPGFNAPHLAVLYQVEQTWTGRLKEYKDTVKLAIFTLDFAANKYPVITSVAGLPHDCVSLIPCVNSVGGVVILTSNSLIYVDQSGRRVTLPVNGWPERISDLSLPAFEPGSTEALRSMELEGSRAAFIDDRTLLVIHKSGTVYPVELVVDGKLVAKLVMGPALAQTTIPTVLAHLGGEHLFIGSTVGPSVLLKTARVEEEVIDYMDVDGAPAAVVDVQKDMDMDDDDIYGDSQVVTDDKPLAAVPKKVRSVMHLALCDFIPGYGNISDMTFSLARNGDRAVPELVAATGTGSLGGFTLFQRDLPIRTKRKLHAIGGARGVWSLPVKQQVKVNGLAYSHPGNPGQPDNDSIVISTDANPSPGLSRIASRSPKGDLTITTRIPGTTIGAAPFFQRTAILHVMTNSIRVLEPGTPVHLNTSPFQVPTSSSRDGTERQVIKDMDGNMPRPKIRACSICDPFVLIIREDNTLGLFLGEIERGKIRRKDVTPMGNKETSRYLAGCFFSDASGLFDSQASGPPTTEPSTLQSAMTAGTANQWLVLVRPQGTLEMWTLPKLALVFSTEGLGAMQNVLTDSSEEAVDSTAPAGLSRKPLDLDIEQILLAPLGETDSRPHLLAFFRSGQLNIYEAVASFKSGDAAALVRENGAPVQFIKTLAKAFDIRNEEGGESTVLAEQKRIHRRLLPFLTSPAPGVHFSGVFLTGDTPSWILSTDKSGVRVHPSGHNVVHSFTPCSLWESQGDFLVYSDEGPSLLEWMPDVSLNTHLPSRSVPRGRPYSNVTFDPTTALVVAASNVQGKFASYDEEFNRTWFPDAPNIKDPVCDCSTLELISPESWITMDGYEFATNEYINAVELVTLETVSTETGSKDFIAVGTTIDRGEDLAAKGATYVFEIVEVVAQPDSTVKRWYKLRLRCKDDAKGAVSAVAGFNGYLVSSMGQKIFVRAFDSDERLVGVAFLDVGVYVTSLKTMKNLLLVGDAVKSVWFVAFQEDPYKLVTLGKDVRKVCVTSADFFFTENQLAITTCDENGVVRMYDYDPRDPDSKHGQQLLCRTEFHGQIEYRTSVVIARRLHEEDSIPEAKIICGGIDGSLTYLTSVDEGTFKRLQLLQGQLTRNIQHVAGLNPKALRIVRNDYVSKPLSKGILDGILLTSFEGLPVARQNEMTRQIGTERMTVLKDWAGLGGAW